ncbi:MAG: DNA repair protein RecO [Clostridiales Family XIII bacterium]|jgi:DNA repair protein RecO (recombination protein O)|nr:DNA repair protein RecO [Clostridiales Family XIII bacterium]
MYTDTEGVVLKQVKTLNGRRMIVLLTRKFGKISAGTSISESGKSKSSLAIRPFTFGRYEINKTRGAYHINGAETLESYYRIGGDVDKFMNCAYVLEFTDKLVPEEAPAEPVLTLLCAYFALMERRPKKFDVLTLAYLLKVLQMWGLAPETGRCARCGAEAADAAWFSAREGGIVCKQCSGAENIENLNDDALIYPLNFGIVNVMKYLMEHTLSDLENLALDASASGLLLRIVRGHISCHLDIGPLKSESLSFNF